MGPVKATTVHSVGLPIRSPTFSLSSAAILKPSIPAFLGVALEPANAGGEVTNVDIPTSSERAADGVFLTARHYIEMGLA